MIHLKLVEIKSSLPAKKNKAILAGNKHQVY